MTFYSNFQTQWSLSFPILSLLFFTRTLTLLWWREKRESLQSRLHITAPFTFPYIFHVSSITNDLKGLTSLENRQAVPNCHPRSDECIIFRIFCYSTFRYCYYVKYVYTECNSPYRALEYWLEFVGTLSTIWSFFVFQETMNLISCESGWALLISN